MASITLNGKTIKVKNGTTILNAAASQGIRIPTLCFLEEINEIGFCRVCVVEVLGEQDLVSSCNTEVKNGMVIETDSKKVIESRSKTLQLLASRHRFDCWRCPKDGMCEFYDILKEYHVLFEEFGPSVGRKDELILGSGISMDQTKCILCKRCVAVCNDVVTAKALKFRDDDGMNPFVSPTVGLNFDQTGCIFCGQCVKVCPTGTLFETDHIGRVNKMIQDPDKLVVVQVAPSVKTAIGEGFGYDIGTPIKETEGKMFRALKMLGFDIITDVAWGADLTVLEEGTELINRIENGGTLPLFTSCCPAWVRYAELYEPDFLGNLSTTKSPHIAQGSLIKHYYGPKYLNKKPKDIYVVSIMPCTAKKYEIDCAGHEVEDIRDVDSVITVRGLIKMINKQNIDFRRLEDYVPVSPLAKFSGAGAIFGASGGVTEAALRTVSEILDKKPLDKLDFKVLRGAEFKAVTGVIKETTITIGGHKLNIAVVHGGAAMKDMMKRIKTGKKKYHFVEFMACPGGCVNGGGMPIVRDLSNHDVIKLRSAALYDQDSEDLPLRKSHENPSVLKAYEEFLGEPNSEKAHKYCHTHFTQKEYKNE